MKLKLQFPPTPENAPKLADLIVQSAFEISKVRLDYSPNSLKDVDEIIEGLRQENLAIENIASTLFCFGCYVGEVFVKSQSAEWKNADETKAKGISDMPLLIQIPNGGVGNPIGKVFKRFQNGEVDSLTYFYRVFTKQS